MDAALIQRAITELESSSSPRIRLLKKAEKSGGTLAIFSSSFNPVTNAHIELMKAAAGRFGLDEVLALAGTSNADKTVYESSLIDRIEMLLRALEGSPQISAGLTSTGFFVDMIGALGAEYRAGTSYSFIVGFDTFVRILDREGKYVPRYHTRFQSRSEVLRYLLGRSRLIVAERGDDGEPGFNELIANKHLIAPDVAPNLAERILFMSFPSDFSERSATEVRENLREGISIERLVPRSVVDYIKSHGLYSTRHDR